MKKRIEIRLFGRFSLLCNGQEHISRSAIKAQEILAYLILNRRTAVRRERLAAEISESHPLTPEPRKDLRHYLWVLHTDLGQIRERVLQIEKEWVQFVPDPGVWVDYLEFQAQAKDPARHSHAVDLYREELLLGWDHSWCVEERERLRQIYLEMLDTLIA